MSDNISNHKLCKICNELKNIHGFEKNTGVGDGYKNFCKLCRNKKRREKYAEKNKKDDESVKLKEKFQQDSEEYVKKISLIDDPDENEKTLNEYVEIHRKYIEKLREKSHTSHFSIKFEEEIDEMIIRGKIQEYLLNKKIMLLPNQIELEKNSTIMKVSLPQNVKLSQIEIRDIIKNIKNS